MTKREKIIDHLVEGGISQETIRCHESTKWSKPGTLVLGNLHRDDWRKLYFDLFRDAPDPKIDIHQIRVNFERKDGYYRITWIGK